MKRLKVYTQTGEDISQLIESRNGKDNGHGMSYLELWYKDAVGIEQKVGYFYCGEPTSTEGFTITVSDC